MLKKLHMAMFSRGEPAAFHPKVALLVLARVTDVPYAFTSGTSVRQEHADARLGSLRRVASRHVPDFSAFLYIAVNFRQRTDSLRCWRCFDPCCYL